MQGAGESSLPVCLPVCLCASCLCMCLLPGSHSMPDINSLFVETCPCLRLFPPEFCVGSRLVCYHLTDPVPVTVSVACAAPVAFALLARRTGGIIMPWFRCGVHRENSDRDPSSEDGTAQNSTFFADIIPSDLFFLPPILLTKEPALLDRIMGPKKQKEAAQENSSTRQMRQRTSPAPVKASERCLEASAILPAVALKCLIHHHMPFRVNDDDRSAEKDADYAPATQSGSAAKTPSAAKKSPPVCDAKPVPVPLPPRIGQALARTQPQRSPVRLPQLFATATSFALARWLTHARSSCLCIGLDCDRDGLYRMAQKQNDVL